MKSLKMKEIVILGSTGSIGTQALEVVDRYPDRFRVIGLACRSDVRTLNEQIAKYRPRYVAVADCDAAKTVALPKGCEIATGEEGVIRLASLPCDLSINALVGISGLMPTMAAIEAGNTIALANKETLVAGGELVMRAAREKGVRILPLDSEHSAIWQCMDFQPNRKIDRILLTASGGAFRDKTKEEIAACRVKEALKHPNWVMGQKVTIDSATMMNKGLEIIEAMRLFDKREDEITVVVQPQSVVHSMIRYTDGSITAQMSYPDMRLPIQLAMLYPERGTYCFRELSFESLHLDFCMPDYEKFPCLSIARECARRGGIYPAVMNAANEELVKYFARDIINFYDIPYYINEAVEKFGARYRLDCVETVCRCHKQVADFIDERMKERE